MNKHTTTRLMLKPVITNGISLEMAAGMEGAARGNSEGVVHGILQHTQATERSGLRHIRAVRHYLHNRHHDTTDHSPLTGRSGQGQALAGTQTVERMGAAA